MLYLFCSSRISTCRNIGSHHWPKNLGASSTVEGSQWLPYLWPSPQAECKVCLRAWEKKSPALREQRQRKKAKERQKDTLTGYGVSSAITHSKKEIGTVWRSSVTPFLASLEPGPGICLLQCQFAISFPCHSLAELGNMSQHSAYPEDTTLLCHTPVLAFFWTVFWSRVNVFLCLNG